MLVGDANKAMRTMKRPKIRRTDLNCTGSILVFRGILHASSNTAVYSTVSAGSHGRASGVLQKGAHNRSDIVPHHLDVVRSLAILRRQSAHAPREHRDRAFPAWTDRPMHWLSTSQRWWDRRRLWRRGYWRHRSRRSQRIARRCPTEAKLIGSDAFGGASTGQS
jgi:hypothetical protein